MALELTFEEIGPLRLCISKEHRFGTDAFLLADFAQARRGDRACDLCSGCGIIPILWLRREERRPAVVYGVELLEQAAKQMDITCRENGLEKIFIPLCRDLRELDREDIPPASLDVVACNPPYTLPGRGIPAQSPHRLAARHQVGGCSSPSLWGTCGTRGRTKTGTGCSGGWGAPCCWPPPRR